MPGKEEGKLGGANERGSAQERKGQCPRERVGARGRDSAGERGLARVRDDWSRMVRDGRRREGVSWNAWTR